MMTAGLGVRRSALGMMLALLTFGGTARAQGTRYQRLLIKNALVIDGAGNPTRGPFDITIEGNTIVALTESMVREGGGSSLGASAVPAGKPDRVIDAAGMYVMPGIIDVHSHIQFSRAGIAMPKDYVFKLLLAHGITTIRDPGSLDSLSLHPFPDIRACGFRCTTAFACACSVATSLVSAITPSGVLATSMLRRLDHDPPGGSSRTRPCLRS